MRAGQFIVTVAGVTSDDINVIDTLYSAQPGRTCDDNANFQDTCASACVRQTSTNVTGD